MLLAAVLWLPIAGAGQSEDLQAEIVMGCIYSVGEFGAELVEICRKENLAAAQALLAYPSEHQELIERCGRRVMGSGGWAGVKLCADQDIEAQAALDVYPAEHRALIAECRKKNVESGQKNAKACVDERLASGVKRLKGASSPER
jgi:hypothetical protein